MSVLKIPNWKTITPFAYYLNPLNDSITVVRKTLLKMNEDGPLRIKYIIEENKQLQDECTVMVKKDYLAQWLVGDHLKQDQFKFIFDTTKIIYDSALRDKLLGNNEIVVGSVLPKLIAYKSILSIRNIQLRKTEEARKQREKDLREGKPVVIEAKDPKKMTQEEFIALQLEQQNNPTANMSDAQKAHAHEEEELAKYGRYWIWEGYFNEKNKQKWLDTAEALKNINDHVLQDIEDFILLEGFKGTKPEKIRQLIEDDHNLRIQQAKKLMPKDGDMFEDKEKIKNRKRKFMNTIRPPDYWNFFDDAPSVDRVQHVLRYNAKPHSSYSDGRVEEIMNTIEEIGMNLQRYEEAKWNTIKKHTLEIFAHEYQEFKRKLED